MRDGLGSKRFENRILGGPIFYLYEDAKSYKVSGNGSC